jgi:hypothetical protein
LSTIQSEKIKSFQSVTPLKSFADLKAKPSKVSFSSNKKIIASTMKKSKYSSFQQIHLG